METVAASTITTKHHNKKVQVGSQRKGNSNNNKNNDVDATTSKDHLSFNHNATTSSNNKNINNGLQQTYRQPQSHLEANRNNNLKSSTVTQKMNSKQIKTAATAKANVVADPLMVTALEKSENLMQSGRGGVAIVGKKDSNKTANSKVSSTTGPKEVSSRNTSSDNNNIVDTNTISNSDNKNRQQQKQPDADINNEISKNDTLTTTTTTNTTTNNSANWNNSKYLHKKFKRLASTNETEEIDKQKQHANEADDGNKTRTVSMSSTASSLSSPPPPPTTTVILQEQRNTSDALLNGHVDSEVQQQLNSANNSNNIHAPRTYNNDSHNKTVSLSQQQSQGQILENNAQTSVLGTSVAGRHVCPFCNLNCTKPSVLQKHIRAHTNERPYPCDLCGIAFKTKSNYYKHCRSRSHGARRRGIEVPADAEDCLSDQEIDADLSNSSSDVISRPVSPVDEQQQHANSSTTYAPNQPQVQLGSPAAGTLPPTNISTSGSTDSRQSAEYKPYKPKFHNAALYATSKETSAKEQQTQVVPAPIPPRQQQQQQAPIELQKQSAFQTHLSMRHEVCTTATSPTPIVSQPYVHVQPTGTPPAHHASLSPSTQMKLNNHINAHQLQMQLQQHHVMAAAGATPTPLPIPPSSLAAAAAGVYYVGHPLPPPPPGAAAAAAAAASILHPTAHLPQQYYSPVAAAVAHQQALATFHLISPQQLHHQMQLQQQHIHQLQQQHHQAQLQQQQQHSTPTAVLPPPPNVLKPAAASITTRNGIVVSQQQANFTNQPTQNYNTNNAKVNGSTVAVTTAPIQLNKEFLQERISKIISQNEAIVENKEHLLQKKYPKLNRSRSFNNNNNNNSNNSNNNNNNNNNNSSNNNSNNNNCNNTTNNAKSNMTVSTNNMVNTNEKTNIKLAQAIVNKQQQQQQQYQVQQQAQQQYQQFLQQQQHHQQQQMIPQQPQINQQHQQQHRLEDSYHTQGNKLPLVNGITKPSANVGSTAAGTIATTMQHSAMQRHMLQTSQDQYVGEPTAHVLPKQQQQQLYYTQEQVKNATTLAICGNNNMPLNLSSKSKQTEHLPTSTIAASSAMANTTTSSNMTVNTPRKRSLEQVPESATPSPVNVINNKPQTPNNSIIKNLLLNARGLAVPTGEGDDAVYKCPLCALEFRTPEDLQLHNSTYCQGMSTSAPISPVASPSYKYFRSNSMSLNLPELKNSIFLKNNPLSLAKLAWSQLKTKPSSLVLSQLSAAQTTGNSTVNKTPKVVTANSSPTMTTSVTPTSTNKVITEAGPLPSPGPLLGKTPLVDAYNNNNSNNSRIKSEDVIITKMHDDTQYNEQLPNKRSKFDKEENYTSGLSLGLLQVVSTKRPHSHSGGEVQVLQAKRDEKPKRFTNSGGCMIPISECADFDQSTKIIRTSLLSGGSFQEVSPRTKDKRESIKIKNAGPTQFQFPPINSITAFNPLTLPSLTNASTSVAGEKIIPYVPGIPGPSSLTPQLPPPPQHLTPSARGLGSPIPRKLSPNRKRSSPIIITTDVKTEIGMSVSPFGGALSAPSEFSRVPPSVTARNLRNWTASKTLESTPKKSFNFLRMADNLSPRKSENNLPSSLKQTPQSQKEVRYFNFDLLNKEQDLIVQPNMRNPSSLTPLQINTSQTSVVNGSEEEVKKSKFLRPTSLPLKPGTFTPKRHHGITPTANTLPLISPETPRPSKACMQLYLNGHAYTYLGLKCSTKMYYCTVNLPQPSYVADMHKLSMYSVWQVCAENNPHPLGFKPKLVMSLYDSRQKSIILTMAGANKLTYSLVISQPLVMTPFVNTTGQYYYHQQKQIPAMAVRAESPELRSKDQKDGVENTVNSGVKKDQQLLVGGYESHEDYTYIRGRGRGRYVCSECGIRCKKPSMLKKHIRTHTDVRPYTCTHCNFR